MIKINELKKLMEDTGYYATEELINDAYNALVLFESSSIDQGQDIYAVCLEGPSGAGKTEFAKTYTKIANALYKNVELVEYQCDATTGKTELYEDINISAAIKNDPEHVNIPGKLVTAIEKVNEGKKVVLFIDEYDKAREETDAFLLQFLQSGKINTTQHGDLGVKEEYKNNLQVVLCKNDMREELSGPLFRRVRIIRLESMRPDVFYKVANNNLVEKSDNPADKKALSSLVNLVSLMYEKAYDQKDMYTRLPSCSEMLIAIQDAHRLSKGGVELSYVYKSILKNMFKSIDDMQTFESIVGNGRRNDDLTKLLKEIKEAKDDDKGLEQLDSLIGEKVLVDLTKELTKEKEKYVKLISEYKTKFEQMEKGRQDAIESELSKIKMASGEFVPYNTDNAIHNFNDESLYIKRGTKVFDISSSEWCEVAFYSYPKLYYDKFVQDAIQYAAEFGITVYEDGFKIGERYGKSLVVYPTKVIGKDNKERIKLSFYADSPLIPSTLVKDIWSFIILIEDHYIDLSLVKGVEYQINTLVYSEADGWEYRSINEDNRVYNACTHDYYDERGCCRDNLISNIATTKTSGETEEGFNDALKKIKQSRKRVAKNE